METGGIVTILNAGGRDFSENAASLLALRHGGPAAATEVFSGTEAFAEAPSFSFAVETGSGFRFTATAEHGEGGTMTLRFDSFQNTVTGARYEYRYRVSVSAWTLEKIVRLFQ